MQFNHTRGTSMGCIADINPILLYDVYQNHCGGRRVKVIRLATGTLRRPPHGNKTRSSASSQEAACRLAVASRVASGTGPPQDGRRSSTRLNLDD
jgi:hypothetical protein